MHCPKCGQQQVSEEIRFCSRCGFQMAGVSQLIANNGEMPALTESKGISPRRRGVYQGIFFFLLAFLVVPILTMITIAIEAEPIAVVVASVLFTVGGLLRIAYALMFESGQASATPIEGAGFAANFFGKTKDVPALPPERSVPADVYAPPVSGRWLDTNDLAKTPGSVTDSTTKLLERERDQ